MLVNFLRAELSERAKKNPAYSLRAFAKALKIHPATLSSILNQKRPLSTKTAVKLIRELHLDPITQKSLLMSAMGQHPTTAESKVLESLIPTLNEEMIRAIQGWEHFAILSLMETKGFQSKVTWIANRLGASTGCVMDALKRLETLKLIKKSGLRWTLTRTGYRTTTDIPSAALRVANREYIEKALYSLENHSVDDRDITGITMAISDKRIREAKRLIQEFRRSLCEFLESGEKNEVYRLNIQLFPIKK